ncbi:MAG: hypothetical protein LUQ71_06680 [Methanoregula sp.]|nr:hypothetical protein [Methanoregula sp.]
MNAGFKLQTPQVYGDRTIIPVVSEASITHGYGMMGSVHPVALLIGENGQWGIALLEGDSVTALLENLVLPA